MSARAGGFLGAAVAPTRADRAIALVLGVVFAAVFFGLLQRRLWGDGHSLFELAVFEDRPWWFTWLHPLYLPLGRILVALDPFGRPFDALGLLSAVPGAAAIGLSFYFARQLGASRAGALVGALLIGAAPASVRFATLVEVHALHGFAVALALVLLVAWAPRWSARGLLVLQTALFALICSTHLTAPTLAPGWIAFVIWVAARNHPSLVEGRAWWRTAILAGIGTVIAFAAVALVAEWTYFRSTPEGLAATSASFIGATTGGSRWPYVRSDWTTPLGLALIPLGVVILGIWRSPQAAGLRSKRHGVAIAGLLWLIPVFAFYTYWGMPNEGGYMAGSLVVLVALIALIEQTPLGRVGVLSAAALIPFVAWQSFADATAWKDVHALARRDDRIAALRVALPAGGLVVSFDPLHTPATIELPNVREFDVLFAVQGLALTGRNPKQIAQEIPVWLDVRVGDQSGVIDASYRVFAAQAGPYAEIVAAFETAIQERFHVTPVPGVDWPLFAFERRAD